MALRIDDQRPGGDRRLHGALVVANHISFLDIVALAGVTPARFVAKREVLQMGGFGHVARVFGVLPHTRGDLRSLRPMIDQVAEVLGIAPRSVDRDWRFARAFLHDLLADA